VGTHYRAMLLADLFSANPLGFTTHPLPHQEDVSDAFEAGGLLVERSDEFIRKNLPTSCHPVTLHCFVLGQKITHMAFRAETEMGMLLKVKRETGGLNTDRLDGRNCHLWLARLWIPRELRGCAAVVRDRPVQVPNTDLSIPVLDLNQAILTEERFRRFEPLDQASS
jgi:hypothetical protein